MSYDETEGRTEADAVAEIALDGAAPDLVELSSPNGKLKATLIATRDGVTLTDAKQYLDARRTEPEFRKGTAFLEDLRSFCDHANRFKDGDSAIFAKASRTDPSLTSVLDYHHAGAANAPRFGHHRGKYAFPLSDEWKRWTGAGGKQLPQDTFAMFIEDGITDVADPASAKDSNALQALLELLGTSFATPHRLLELSRGLSVNVGSKVSNQINTSTGEMQLTYVTTHESTNGSQVKVPGAFLLALPVFRSGALYHIAARLRYRVKEGSITWSYELVGADKIFDHAFNEACETAAKATGLPLFMGQPE